MSNKILVPALGESITEATVSKWLKTKGDKVSSDEPLVELETDKVNVEVPAPSNGVLEKISVQEGQTVNVGSLLGMINGSTKQTSSVVKEIKTYSPPKQKKQKVETKSKPLEDKKVKPLKLEEEEALILEDLAETENQESKQISKKID